MEAKNVMFPALCDEIFHVLTLQCLPLSIFSRLTNTVFKVFPSGSFVIDQRRAVISIWSVAFVWCLLSGFFFVFIMCNMFAIVLKLSGTSGYGACDKPSGCCDLDQGCPASTYSGFGEIKSPET